MINNLQKGVAIFLALMITTILLAVALGISTILISQMKMFRGMEYSVVAFYAADTGIERILYAVRKEGYDPVTCTPTPCNPSCTNCSYTWPNGVNYSVRIENPSSSINYKPVSSEPVYSRGSYQNSEYAYDDGFNDTTTWADIDCYQCSSIEAIKYIWNIGSLNPSNFTLYYTWSVEIVPPGNVYIWAWNYSLGSWVFQTGVDGSERLETRTLNLTSDYITSAGDIEISFNAEEPWGEGQAYTDLYDVYVSITIPGPITSNGTYKGTKRAIEINY